MIGGCISLYWCRFLCRKKEYQMKVSCSAIMRWCPLLIGWVSEMTICWQKFAAGASVKTVDSGAVHFTNFETTRAVCMHPFLAVFICTPWRRRNCPGCPWWNDDITFDSSSSSSQPRSDSIHNWVGHHWWNSITGNLPLVSSILISSSWCRAGPGSHSVHHQRPAYIWSSSLWDVRELLVFCTCVQCQDSFEILLLVQYCSKN